MTNKYLNTNKAYRAYEGFEEALYLASDITDLMVDCREDIRYGQTNVDTFIKLNEVIVIADQIKELIKEKKIIEE